MSETLIEMTCLSQGENHHHRLGSLIFFVQVWKLLLFFHLFMSSTIFCCVPSLIKLKALNYVQNDEVIYVPIIWKNKCDVQSNFNVVGTYYYSRISRMQFQSQTWGIFLCTHNFSKITDTSSDTKKSRISIWKLITFQSNKQN